MSERSLPWGGSSTGDCGPYSDADWAALQEILASSSRFEGVAANYLNSMVGSVTGANSVSIDSGGALVDGKIYQNTAPVAVTIPSAVGGGNTRIDRIVLRADWAAQTVRITRIAGTDAGSPTAPAITQTSGTTYDIMLYQALVNPSGAVILTDERISAALVVWRQGGGADYGWGTGTANFNVVGDKVAIQLGVALSVVGVTTVTFPLPFAVKPVVFCTAIDFPPGKQVGLVRTVETTYCEIAGIQTDTGNLIGSLILQWIAVGPLA